MPSSILVHEAVSAWWNAAAFAATFDGPYDTEADESAEFPYVVFSAPPASRNWRSNTSQGWNVPFRLSIYDRTKVLCKAHVDAIAGPLEAASSIATSSSTTFLQLQLISELYVEEDEGVWKAVLTFDVDWAKPNPA